MYNCMPHAHTPSPPLPPLSSPPLRRPALSAPARLPQPLTLPPRPPPSTSAVLAGYDRVKTAARARVAVNAVVGGGGDGGGCTGCRGPQGVAGEVRVIWLDVSMFECPMGARVVVAGVAGCGGLRWWRGTRVVVVRCVLQAETAVGRSKQ